MEKVSSYYDWQQKFKKSSTSQKTHSIKRKKNSIGLSEEFFRDYISKWKKKYLE